MPWRRRPCDPAQHPAGLALGLTIAVAGGITLAETGVANATFPLPE
jgi:hypothetical protein